MTFLGVLCYNYHKGEGIMNICIAQYLSNNSLNENLTTAKNVIKKAKEKSCDLVVFPELFLSGYLLGENLKTNSINLKHFAIKELKQTCAECNIACVVGFPRKEKNLIYNSACFIEKTGEILDVYDKTHLFGDEKLYFAKGQKLKTFDSSLGKIGLLICYDIEIPEASRTLAINGATTIICISANMKPYDDLHKKFIEIRALENTANIIYCNYVGKNEQFSFVGRSNIITNEGKNVCKYSKTKKLIFGTLLEKTIEDENMIYLNNIRPELYEYNQKENK